MEEKSCGKEGRGMQRGREAEEREKGEAQIPEEAPENQDKCAERQMCRAVERGSEVRI